MIQVTFFTNYGTFVGYLMSDGEIRIYENEDEVPVAAIQPLLRRKPVLDTSTDGVAGAMKAWLEQNYSRVAVECIRARISPPKP